MLIVITCSLLYIVRCYKKWYIFVNYIQQLSLYTHYYIMPSYDQSSLATSVLCDERAILCEELLFRETTSDR